jgi:hypothetical protein
LPGIGNTDVHVETPVGPVWFVPQVVAIQVGEIAAIGVQEATPVGPVVNVVQLVVV